MTVLVKIANNVVSTDYNDLPCLLVKKAKIAILDTLCCSVLGARHPAVDILKRTHQVSETGDSYLIGESLKASMLDAALINGTAAHALDFDDVSITIGGHPSAPILPALISLAEKNCISGRALVSAFVAGLEAQAHIARMVNYHHYSKGWHPTVTLGTFGAAAACSRLLDLNASETATAMALSASFSSGIKGNFGSMAKPLHVGHANRIGILAATLASNGFTANKAVLEHEHGFFNVYNGVGNYKVHNVDKEWGAPFDIMSPGIGVKQYPCCDSTHVGIDLCNNFKDQVDYSIEDLDCIKVYVNSIRLKHVNRPSPKTPTEAKFSIQYCMAYALIKGRIDMEAFSDDAIKNKDVLSLMSNVEAYPLPSEIGYTSESHATKVVISKDGNEIFSEFRSAPEGRDNDYDELEKVVFNKINKCLSPLLGIDEVESLKKMVNDIDSYKVINGLPELCIVK